MTVDYPTVTPFPDLARVVSAARTMLLEAGCPVYAVVARSAESQMSLGSLAFSNHSSASHLARSMHGDDPSADVFVVERLQRVGRYRWTVWDLDGENRLHEEFEALPDWL